MQPLREMPCLWKWLSWVARGFFSVCVRQEWFFINPVVSCHSEILFLHYYLQIQELETSGICPSSMTLNLALLNFIVYLLSHISMPYSSISEGY